MRKSEQDLIDQLLFEQKLGFYTEFFVEAGYLNQSEPLFQAGNFSDYFDLASLTKALATGPLVHHEFRNRLSSPLNALIPIEASQKFSADLMKLTPLELLSHRSGLPSWRNFWLGHLFEGPSPAAQFLNPLIPNTFDRVGLDPSKPDVYSDLGYILLGYALEAASGSSLTQLWDHYCHSIGLQENAPCFSIQLSAPPEQFIPTAFCAIRDRLMQGEVHDENSAALGGVSGHAGLFAKGPSVGGLLKSLYHANEGKTYLEANAKELENHSFEGLSGFRRGNGKSAELFAEGHGMGHLGFVGTAFWIDWASLRYGVFLTNRVISGRVNTRITQLRREVFGKINELFG